jgi:hypothetical protein
VLVERKVEDALTMSDQLLQQAGDSKISPVEKEDQDLVECSRLLRQLCPACFGGSSFGRPLEEYVEFSFIYVSSWLTVRQRW